MSERAIAQEPKIGHSELTNKVYILTRYEDRNGILIAQEKFEITDEFDKIVQARAKWKAPK